VHGKDDTVVPFDQSTSMVAALKTAGKDVTFVQYDHTDHWETNEASRIDMYKTIATFLEKHNPPA
jgi:dipeptidyl aminopeptidase/acylaminoacyl peptidase